MELNFAALVKDGGEKYIFLWDDESAGLVGRVVERMAADRQLSFTRRDANCIQDVVCDRRQQHDPVLNRPE